MKYIYYIVFLASTQLFAQKEATWLGNFSYDSDTITIKNFYNTLTSNFFETAPQDQIYPSGPSINIADKNTGVIKLISHGSKVYDTTGRFISNGILTYDSIHTRQDYTTIIPLEEYNQEKYIVITRFIKGGFPQTDSTNFDLQYSVIEYLNHKPIVTKKNISVLKGVDRVGQMGYIGVPCATIKHANNIDTWLLMKHSKQDAYYVFLVNSCGVTLTKKIEMSRLGIPNYQASPVWNPSISTYTATPFELYHQGILTEGSYYNNGSKNMCRFDRGTGNLTFVQLYKSINYTGSIRTTSSLLYFEPLLKDNTLASGYGNVYLDTADTGYILKYDINNSDNNNQLKVTDTIKIRKEEVLSKNISGFYGVRGPLLVPYLNGSMLALNELSCYTNTSYSCTDYLLYAFTKFEYNDKLCSNCTISKSYKLTKIPKFLKSLYPGAPWMVSRELNIHYYLHNRTHFEPNWKAPEMGKISKISVVADCKAKKTNLYMAVDDSLRGDSVVLYIGADKVKILGDSLKYIKGKANYNFTHTGTYIIKAIRYINCMSDTVTKAVTINQTQIIPAIQYNSIDTLYSCTGEARININFKTQKGIDYLIDGDTAQVESVHTLGKNKTYTVTAESNCGTRDTVFEPRNLTLLIPNIITPNADGKNDTFILQPQNKEKGQLEVYSRWGTLVYKSDKYSHDWPKNDELDSGVYYYQYISNLTHCSYKGWLEVNK